MEQDNSTFALSILLIGIAIGLAIFAVYMFYLAATTKRRKESQLNDELLKYKRIGEEKLYSFSIEELENIAKHIANEKNESREYGLRSVAFIQGTVKLSLNRIGAEIGFDAENNTMFQEYQTGIKRLDLELKSESINNEGYKKQFDALQKRLIKSVWDITSTSPSTAKKLLDLGLISEKQFQTVEERAIEDGKVKEENKKKEKSFFVNYILGKTKL